MIPWQVLACVLVLVLLVAGYVWALTYDKMNIARHDAKAAHKLAAEHKAALDAVEELSPEYAEVFPRYAPAVADRFYYSRGYPQYRPAALDRKVVEGVNWAKVRKHAAQAREHRKRDEGLDAFVRDRLKFDAARERRQS